MTGSPRQDASDLSDFYKRFSWQERERKIRDRGICRRWGESASGCRGDPNQHHSWLEPEAGDPLGKDVWHLKPYTKRFASKAGRLRVAGSGIHF